MNNIAIQKNHLLLSIFKHVKKIEKNVNEIRNEVDMLKSDFERQPSVSSDRDIFVNIDDNSCKSSVNTTFFLKN